MTLMQALLLLLYLAATQAIDLPEGITRCDDPKTSFSLRAFTENNPMPFCANHGACRLGGHDDANDSLCSCPQGWGGPHCEIPVDLVTDDCLLPCENGGKCRVGAVTWEDLFDESFRPNREYCQCPIGYHGVVCEKEAETCGPELVCHNGGTCVVIRDSVGETSYHCDCTTAGNFDMAFAGETCEYSSSVFCSSGLDHNGRHFCVNGGVCKGESHMGCVCKEGFVGPVCEFTDMGFEPPECSLKCFNYGICRKGAKDLTVLRKFGIQHRHLQETAYNDDFEHCVCPAGYAGLQCEYQVDVCPGNQHVCLNGGDCSPKVVKDEVVFDCDCRTARASNARFAGDYCEMESTEFCTSDRSRPHRGKGQDAFCTNGGTCLGLVQHGQEHLGCDCPLGTFGPQCQYVGADSVVVPRSTRHSKSQAVLVVFTVVMLLIALAALYSLYSHKRQLCRQIHGVTDPAAAPTIDAVLNVDPWNAVHHDLYSDGMTDDRMEMICDDDEGDGIFQDDNDSGEYEDVDLSADTPAPPAFSGHDHESLDGSLFSDPSLADSSITMDASDDGVTLKQANNTMSIVGSELSDAFHVFHDSQDGSERGIV